MTDEMKIRGKRRRPAQKASDGQPRPRGRPMKPAAELAVNRRKVKLSKLEDEEGSFPSSAVEEATGQTSLSRLERLPPELMQQIFFHALDVNMVKSSPVINRMLSNDSTYNLLIFFAFFDDDGVHPVETTHFKPAAYRKLSIAEKVRLQEGIMSCRWCTFERIKACMPTLTRLKIVQEWHKEHNVTKSWVSDPPSQGRSRTQPPKMPPLEEHLRLANYFLVHPLAERADGKRASRDESVYSPRLIPFYVSVDKKGNACKQRATGSNFAFPSTLAVRYIPEHLLKGRLWTPEKLEYLKLLRQGNRFIQCDFILHMSAEAIFKGMEDAIEERSGSALLVLLDLHDFRFHINNTTLCGIKVMNNNPHNQRHTNPHSEPIPLRLFHLATKHGFEDSQVLLALLSRAGIDTVPHDDPTMTKWALQASERYSSPSPIYFLGKWLLSYMEGGFQPLIFSRGYSVPVIGWARRESFGNEIGYEQLAQQSHWPFSVEVESGNYI